MSSQSASIHTEAARTDNGDAGWVAVVNDDIIQLRVLTGLLHESGLQVLSCRSADDALARMDPDAPPDLIVTDLHMPGIDGWRFCRLLRSAEYPQFNRVPILVNSATFSGEDACQITAELGANAFMPSPIHGACFVEQVWALLRGDVPGLTSKVLIVDDSTSLLGSLKAFFENNGYRAYTAANGAEGLRLFETLRPEMAVLDFHLPDTDGERLLLKMKALNPRSVFVMITSDPRPELALNWMRSGAAAYVRKPFDPTYLITLCENARRERSLLHVEEILEARTRELRDSEIRYRTVFQNAPEMMCSLNEAGRICDVNRKLLEKMGYEREEIIGETLASLLIREPGEASAADPFEFLTGPRGCKDMPCRYVLKEGSVMELLVNCEVAPDPILKKIRLCVIRDITEQKRNERIRIGRSRVLEKMTSSVFLPEVLTTLVEASEAVKPDMSGMVLLFDRDTGRIRHWIAPGLADAIDQVIRSGDPDLLRDHPLLEVCRRKRVVVGDVQKEDWHKGVKALLKSQGICAIWTEPIVSSDGEAYGVLAMLARRPCRPDAPDSEFMRGTAQLAALAIERKRVEDALRESEHRYRKLVEGSPVPILVHTGERVAFVNQEAVKAFGSPSKDALLNKPVLDLVHPKDHQKVMERIRLMYSRKASVPMIEERFLRLSGESFDVEVAGTSIDYMGKPASQVVFRDITDRKQAEAERLKLETQIQKFESLTVLAGSIAHSFNNLLMGVMGNIDLAMSHLDAESPIRHSLLGACKSAKRASELSTLMLTYTGKKQADKTLVELVDLVEGMIEVLEEVSVSRKAVMTFNRAVESAYLYGDPIQVRDLIMQLMMNASEALGNEGGAITLTVDKGFCDPRRYRHPALKTRLPEGEYIFLEVADTGCGIDPEALPKVFDPFFTTKFMGRGMGLATVLGVIRAHNGGIAVASEPEKGSRIRIVFPAVQAKEKESKTGPKPIPKDAEAWRGSGKVLLVDDDEVVLGVGKRMLEKLGFEVVTAADGFEAVAVFREQAQSLRCVVLALSMPRMDGEDTFREIRTIRKDVPVLLSSGYTEEQVSSRFKDSPPAGFIHKPYRLSVLSEKIQEVLAQGV